MMRYSGLDTAHKCLRKYQLQYIERIPQPGVEGLDLAFGTGIHLGVQTCLEGGDPVAIFNTFWDSYRNKELVKSRMSYDELADLGPVFLSRFERLHAKYFSHVTLEQTIKGTLGGHAFEGTPDVVGLYNGIPSIVDFKTSNYAYPKERILVNEQMPIYAHLANQSMGYEVKQLVYFVFVKSTGTIQRPIVVPLTKKLLDSAIRNAIIMSDDLKTRKVYPMNPNSCMMGTFKCPYFDTCHKGKLDE